MRKSHAAGWVSDSPTPAQLKELFDQIESGKVTKDRFQAFLSGEIPVQSLIGLTWRGKVASLQVTIDYDKTIEQLVAEVKASDWTISSSITTERQSFEGMPAKPEGIQMRSLSVVSPIKAGQVWSTSKVLSNLKAPGLAFDFHSLCEFIKYRDELLDYGIKYISAMGSRFRYSGGEECVACLYLAYRSVCLFWAGDDWVAFDSFGQARNS